MNAIVNKNFFPLIKDNKVWVGMGFNLSMVFKTQYPNLSENNRKYVISRGYDPDDGYVATPAIAWYTNLSIDKRRENLELVERYTPEKFPSYDNYKAINVNKVVDIPADYDGVMGVPVSFMGKHNPDQFDIVGMAAGNSRATGFNFDVPYTPHREDRGGCAVLNGKRLYTRILIKRRKT